MPDVTAPDAQKWFDLEAIEEELAQARWVLSKLRIEQLLNLDPENDEAITQALERAEMNIGILLRQHAIV